MFGIRDGGTVISDGILNSIRESRENRFSSSVKVILNG
jgi:hypothetical protein